MPKLKKHKDDCGCNSCFIETCNKIDNISKDSLINAIRNFMKFKSKETTDLESHETGCMCINHLIYYKEKHVQVLDKLLEKLKTDDTQKESNIESKNT